jgi:2-polyprenyl-3-methyl-5-hydroxy-6-metoxy-1,4-benzoquinol methylase
MTRKNSGLKNIYNNVYKKGEETHYTRLIFSKGKVTNDKRAVLSEVKWKGKDVLDVGCGTGELAFLISKRGALKVAGVDYSPEAIEVARKTYKRKNLKFEVGDIKRLHGKFDVVTALGTLEHTDDPFSTLKLLKSFTKQGGSLVVTCPNWVNPRGYMLQMLRFLFNARITLADIHYLTPVEFENWAKKLRMKLVWRTVDHDWAHGDVLIGDFKRRIPNILKDLPFDTSRSRVEDFLGWLEAHLVKFEKNSKFGGVTGVYHFKK